MDFGDNPQEAKLRAEVRQFIEENKSPEAMGGGMEGGTRTPQQVELQNRVRDKGWIGGSLK